MSCQIDIAVFLPHDWTFVEKFPSLLGLNQGTSNFRMMCLLYCFYMMLSGIFHGLPLVSYKVSMKLWSHNNKKGT